MSRESKILIGLLVVIVGAMIGLFMLANQGTDNSGPKATGDATKFVRENSHKLGTGSVQLVEYGDYQCPACGNAEPVIKRIMQEYDGKVTFYFRNYPLTNIHTHALSTAQAAEAAAAQGKFWEMHDKLYAAQKEWSDLTPSQATDKFVEYAKALGLDGDKIRQAIDNNEYDAVIDQDLADGQAQSVSATPTFFVNGKQVQTTSYEKLKEAIDAALGATPAASPSPTPTPAL